MKKRVFYDISLRKTWALTFDDEINSLSLKMGDAKSSLSLLNKSRLPKALFIKTLLLNDEKADIIIKIIQKLPVSVKINIETNFVSFGLMENLKDADALTLHIKAREDLALYEASRKNIMVVPKIFISCAKNELKNTFVLVDEICMAGIDDHIAVQLNENDEKAPVDHLFKFFVSLRNKVPFVKIHVEVFSENKKLKSRLEKTAFDAGIDSLLLPERTVLSRLKETNVLVQEKTICACL